LSYLLAHVFGFGAVIAIAIRPMVTMTILRTALLLYALGICPVN